jgi:hypothetical protein
MSRETEHQILLGYKKTGRKRQRIQCVQIRSNALTITLQTLTTMQHSQGGGSSSSNVVVVTTKDTYKQSISRWSGLLPEKKSRIARILGCFLPVLAYGDTGTMATCAAFKTPRSDECAHYLVLLLQLILQS